MLQWALISSRVKTILSLALDFYSIQRTLCGGGAAPAIKARCQLEIERVGRQFDECIAFLLRVIEIKFSNVLSGVATSPNNHEDFICYGNYWLMFKDMNGPGAFFQIECWAFPTFSRASYEDKLQFLLCIGNWTPFNSSS